MSDPVRTLWTVEAILDDLYQHRDELRAMGVMRIGLFGSYARGEQRADSDMDFLVTMRSPSYRDLMNLWHFLEDHFGCAIDVGEESLIKPAARHSLLSEVRDVAGF